jgi:excisionase family DNA binding protein
MSINIGDLVLYDIEELAEKLGVRSRYVRKLLADGDLQGKKFAKKWYVSEKSLTDYFSQVDPPTKKTLP